MKKLDNVELEYERAMARTDDPELLLELSVGLKQYRDLYKGRPEYEDTDD